MKTSSSFTYIFCNNKEYAWFYIMIYFYWTSFRYYWSWQIENLYKINITERLGITKIQLSSIVYKNALKIRYINLRVFLCQHRCFTQPFNITRNVKCNKQNWFLEESYHLYSPEKQLYNYIYIYPFMVDVPVHCCHITSF